MQATYDIEAFSGGPIPLSKKGKILEILICAMIAKLAIIKKIKLIKKK